MRLLLLGATGLVGSSTLKLALANPGISEVVAITRRPLPPQNKILNPVCERIEELAQSARTWVVDAVVCALGTTKAKAGTKEALRHVDYDLPLVFAGRDYIAKPDLVERIAIGAALNSGRPEYYYGSSAVGYIDYPFLGQETQALVKPQTT